FGDDEEEVKLEKKEMMLMNEDELNNEEEKYPQERVKTQITLPSPHQRYHSLGRGQLSKKKRNKNGHENDLHVTGHKRNRMAGRHLPIKPTQRQCPDNDETEYWNLYYAIFNIVEEWSRNSRCTLFCYQLIIKMLCCANIPFYYHVLRYQANSRSGYYLPHHYAVKRRETIELREKRLPTTTATVTASNSHAPLQEDKSIPGDPNKSQTNLSHPHDVTPELTSTGHLKVLTFQPDESYIIRQLTKYLAQVDTKRDMLELLCQLMKFCLATNQKKKLIG
ncbi:hypothetical protein RFI_29117, partial [Reticulomyxa filosa]